MVKGQNFNRPDPGSKIKVQPIKTAKDIETIKKLLKDNPLHMAIFTLGINTNLRASDLLSIKVSQVRGLKPMSEIDITERKTGKSRKINLNKKCVDAINELLASRTYQEDDYLFIGQRGRLTVPYLNNLVKSWCAKINLKGNYGSHTLRKTFGHIQHVNFGVPLPELMVCYNHATQKQTLDYLCIQPDEIRKVYANEI
ncbi:MAG TPA: tyrosine-type recombinase/integrase [Smithella sp.]|mgnify:FL=1|nr:tyrosine-type recombinase/integrase [Smithella sp.]